MKKKKERKKENEKKRKKKNEREREEKQEKKEKEKNKNKEKKERKIIYISHNPRAQGANVDTQIFTLRPISKAQTPASQVLENGEKI